uniref:trypsin n=1 Tax=Pundamilia nyererei TaxID=303518 RepID=A0A3B4FGP6_9CICH
MIIIGLMIICRVLMQSRIVGGHTAAPNSIRYLVSLKSTSGQHFCGGSLVHRYWVLTAAHYCWRKPQAEQMMIVAGDYKVNIFEGTEQYAKPRILVIHPLYNRSTNNADIMLIKVPQNRCRKVTSGLLKQGTGVAEGHVCRVSGWGYNSLEGGQVPVTLRTVTVPIVSTARCNSSDSFNGNITANMICAGYSTGGKDACKGDSGGPLVCDRRIYGVVSWGNGCGDAKFPGVYTAVSRFRRWIDQTIYGSYLRCFKPWR